jgi:hypothetical protein
MKNVIRAAIMSAFIAAVAFSVPAHAFNLNTDRNIVRASQQRLDQLGYYGGRTDGIMTAATQKAILEFQSVNGLILTGELNEPTYRLLFTEPSNMVSNLMSVQTAMPVAYAAPAATLAPTMIASNGAMLATPVAAAPLALAGYQAIGLNAVPSRFANLDLGESFDGMNYHYNVAMNGISVLQANFQPGKLRVSGSYSLGDEDAMIFTIYGNEAGCTTRHFLLSVRLDGSFTGPYEIGRCSAAYDATVKHGALFVNFVDNQFSNWKNTWRYEDGQIIESF